MLILVNFIWVIVNLSSSDDIWFVGLLGWIFPLKFRNFETGLLDLFSLVILRDLSVHDLDA